MTNIYISRIQNLHCNTAIHTNLSVFNQKSPLYFTLIKGYTDNLNKINIYIEFSQTSNIFLNDIFNFVEESILYNYADDNTLSYSDTELNKVVDILEKESLNLIHWFSHNQMKANPDKFQAIAIGSKTLNESISFNLEGNKIDCEKEVKLLGVTIDCQLKFNTHISNICKKASRQLNVLKRIGKHLTKLGRLTIYFSFIMSNFNYCPIVWHFCGETNTRKIEKNQERALRFIYEDYSSSYEDLLKKSRLPTLKIRRLRTMAIEVYKIFNKKKSNVFK